MAGLVLELQKDAMDSSIKSSDLLRKALVVAKKLAVREFQEWVENELNGYEDMDKIPTYREVTGVIKGYDPNVGWIPAVILDERIANILLKRKMRQSIGDLESLVGMASSGFVLMQYPPEVENVLMRIGSYEAKPGLFVGANIVHGILDRVRNAVLEWALKLEEEGILGEGLTFSHEEKQKAQGNPSINIGQFQGIFGNISDSNVTQNLEMSIQPGNFKTLSSFLRSKGVGKEDISELEKAVGSDSKPESANAFGEKVSSWIGKMVKKAASGAWQVSITTAGNVLAAAIKAYYGLS
jgi:hypothetical protein